MYGLDISPEMIAEIDVESPSLREVRVGKGEDVPRPTEYFDAVFCRGSLHHMEDTPRALREIHRTLKLQVC